MELISKLRAAFGEFFQDCHRFKENIPGPWNAGDLPVLRQTGRDNLSTLDKSGIARCDGDDYGNVLYIKPVGIWPEFSRLCLDDLASSADGAAG